MIDSDARFFNFPISYLRRWFTDKNVCNDIIYYGTYYAKERTEFSTVSSYYNGNYYDKGNIYDNDIANVKKLLGDEKKIEEDEIEDITRYYIASRFLKYKINKNLYDQYKAGKRLFEKNNLYIEDTNSYKRISVETGISVNMLFDYRDNQKTEFEQLQLLAFLALKSIIGAREYTKASMNIVLARMAGFNSVKESVGKLPKNISQFETRYWREKLFGSLQEKWKLYYYSSHMHGFYYGFSDDPNFFNNLVFYAESGRKKAKGKERSDKIRIARDLALMKLGMLNK